MAPVVVVKDGYVYEEYITELSVSVVNLQGNSNKIINYISTQNHKHNGVTITF